MKAQWTTKICPRCQKTERATRGLQHSQKKTWKSFWRLPKRREPSTPLITVLKYSKVQNSHLLFQNSCQSCTYIARLYFLGRPNLKVSVRKFNNFIIFLLHFRMSYGYKRIRRILPSWTTTCVSLILKLASRKETSTAAPHCSACEMPLNDIWTAHPTEKSHKNHW